MVLFQISPTALCSLDTAIIPWLLLPADGNTHLRGIPGKLNASKPPCSSITSLFVLYSIDLPGSLQIAAPSKRTADVSGRWAVGFQSHCGLRVSRIILEQVNEVGQIPTLQQQRLCCHHLPGDLLPLLALSLSFPLGKPRHFPEPIPCHCFSLLTEHPSAPFAAPFPITPRCQVQYLPLAAPMYSEQGIIISFQVSPYFSSLTAQLQSLEELLPSSATALRHLKLIFFFACVPADDFPSGRDSDPPASQPCAFQHA